MTNYCTTCHGDVGVSNERRYPHLAAQNKTYLETRLRYFRSGTEPGQQMNGQAAPLTDLEIELIADYFSKQPGA